MLCQAHAAQSMLSFLSSRQSLRRWQEEALEQQEKLQCTAQNVIDTVGRDAVNIHQRVHCPAQAFYRMCN